MLFLPMTSPSLWASAKAFTVPIHICVVSVGLDMLRDGVNWEAQDNSDVDLSSSKSGRSLNWTGVNRERLSCRLIF